MATEPTIQDSIDFLDSLIQKSNSVDEIKKLERARQYLIRAQRDAMRLERIQAA